MKCCGGEKEAVKVARQVGGFQAIDRGNKWALVGAI
jgi:hypothetical protein